uniref:Dynein cytoplasmic 1 intermediate chain 1 n=1 Tax=Anas zonorhyncha TaxID=75864 RepID=A0A8B9U0R2_9AVES
MFYVQHVTNEMGFCSSFQLILCVLFFPPLCCTADYHPRTLQWDTDPSVLQLQSDSELGRRLHKLGVSKITQVDFLPREVVSYSKETQTPLATHQSEEDEDDEEMVEPKAQDDLETENQDQKQEVKEAPPRELTEEEKQQVLHSEEFLIFFDRTIRVIERALAEDSDIFFDYSGRDVEEKDGDVQAGANLSFNRQFYDEHWSKHRVVTCMDWSLQYPELMVASYNNNEDAPHEPDGVALVWNMKFKKTTPEYVFHCQSSVMSVCFARFHPNLVVGGTYSGQIVLWDNRSHRRTPVQRTPLSAAAHTHPVYCVNVVGTQNAHNLITVSTDGKMCSWSLDMLSTPQESMELVYNKSKPVAVTGMAFPTGDVNNFVVGSEEGTVYTACRHGSKAGIGEIFEGHQGPVTGINCHMAVGPIDFSHLFVTSSFDWTVKLWTTKHNKPLYSFEDNADYVYDVMWSPVHPALFACVDGMGRLDLWNLNNDTEVGEGRASPEPAGSPQGAGRARQGRAGQGRSRPAAGGGEPGRPLRPPRLRPATCGGRGRLRPPLPSPPSSRFGGGAPKREPRALPPLGPMARGCPEQRPGPFPHPPAPPAFRLQRREPPAIFRPHLPFSPFFKVCPNCDKT